MLIIGISSCIVIAAATAFSGARFEAPPDPPSDSVPIPPPGVRPNNTGNDNFNRMVTRPFINFFTLSRYYRAVSGDKIKAKNVDAMGEVPNSTWFTNRISTGTMVIDGIVRGSETKDGPDTSGVWTVTKTKLSGASRGMNIRDNRGREYIIKFDPPGYPELSTGAEMISTKIFHAAGYNVPENYLVAFDPAAIRVGEKVRIKPPREKLRFMTAADLDSILYPLERLPNEKLRILASNYIDGITLGGWRYHGTRPDDPNDVIPHEHRRELRGLRLIAGWVNHFDNILDNTLDVYDPHRKFVKHYYLDFNNTFGSYTTGPMPPARGHQMLFKFTSFFGSFLTAGFYTRPWETYDTMPYRSVGTWESKTYEPREFKFTLQAQAFDNMTDEDAFWAAKIVMSFSDSIIAALVRTARYSNPEAERYIGRVLAERRDKIGRYYYARVNPLDDFRLVPGTRGGYELCFVDRAVADGLAKPDRSEYRYRFSGDRCAKAGSTDSARIAFFSSNLSFSDSVAEVRIVTFRSHSTPSESEELCIFLRQHPGGALSIIGIDR